MSENELGQKLAQGVGALCSRNWWVFLIGGLASVIFGIMAFMKPGVALLVLAMFFSAYVLVDGAVNIWGAITHRNRDGWWALLLLGIVGFVAGGFALLYPPVSMIALIYVVAFVAMFIGVISIYLGWKISAEVPNEWLLYLTGTMSIIFALLLLFQPGIGGLSVVYMIAFWAIFIGTLRIWFAFRIRKLGKNIGATTA
ncbi:MAG TPA: HdeD family acid-resistance protein [Woeseiaceae bacterium]|nr:HdeD family acid-resistance protein [Woeseiaceae bacterium]